MTTQTYTLADADTLKSRMQMHGVMPEPVDGFCAALADRLSGQALAGKGVTNAAILMMAEMVAAGRTLNAGAAWGQLLLMVEACLIDAPEPVRREAADHFLRIVLTGPGLC